MSDDDYKLDRDTLANNATQHREHAQAAHLFAADAHGRLMHVTGIGWHRWNGEMWVAEDSAAPLALHAFNRHNKLALDVNLNEAKDFQAVLSMAKPLLSVDADRLDADPHLFNTPHGVLDLRDCTVWPHDPKYLMTKISGGSYVPGKPSGVADQFIAQVLPDADYRRYVAQLFGLAMFGQVKERVFPLFYGAGFNGKSTLLEAMMYAFGTYGVTISSETLVASTYARHTTELTVLRGARLAVASETESGQSLRASLIKNLTSPGRMNARKIRQDDITWEKSHTVFMDTNHKPRVNGSDKAMFDRIRIVEFDQDFTNRKDTELPDKLRAEADALVTFAFNGWQDYRENGLAEPAGVKAATTDYRDESDTVGQWLTECTVHSSESTPRTVLHTAYVNWAKSEHVDPSDVLVARDFYTALERKNLRATKYRGVRVFANIEVVAYSEPSPFAVGAPR
jgi:putative DNA primase/helicase